MIRILIAVADAQARETLRAALTDAPDIEIAAQARDGHEAVQLAHAVCPDIALLAVHLPVCNGWEAAEFIGHSSLATEVILLSEGRDDLRLAMRAGAREQVTWPGPPAPLLSALRAVAEEQQRRRSAAFTLAADPQRMCRIVTVSGAKGGIGKTTLAANLALSLHLETDEEVALVDLYTQFGDVAMLLNLSPRHTLAELARSPLSEIDASVLEDHLERHSSGIHVLAGATTPVALDAISVPFLDHLFGLLKQRARYVVLDVPPILHPTTLHALSHATRALLVANLFDLTTAKDTRLLLDAIEGHYVARSKIMLVLNRVSRQNRLLASDVEAALGHPIAAQIPNDGRLVPHSVNQGEPFVLSQPRSAVAQSVRSLACQIIGEKRSAQPVHLLRQRLFQ